MVLDPETQRPLFVSTWSFGKGVNDAAVKSWRETGSMLNAIEHGIWDAESDPTNDSVGLGGIPNSDGVVQVDACIMSGPGHRAGAVCGVESVLHPISVARRVMESTRHVMLSGEGARQFAIEHGFELCDLLTEAQKEKFAQRQQRKASESHYVSDNHDTITLLGLDAKGDLYAGCSTSGRAYKLPGRVGDSPIVGAGLYVDNDVGAAGATGNGENVMRYCASFQIVEAMRNGESPQQAVESVIRRIIAKDELPAEKLAINFIAIDKQGRYGAAGTSKGFQFAVATPNQSRLREAMSLTDEEIREGGNVQ